ncbi:ectomycorrhiza-upregulated exo-beta-1,3-glucanase GH5 [Pholiota conissans]|uniref:glucan 1,3-beta-glucosidase n=1 Tax=Pholiota conissans TaxID=109636 RepID=A0A9P5Z205_9AGAR|nr:ectomycorrhiza-upregulated exo-beta-1,3-glucanase GH5 [Pholiota conissans]
MLLAGKREDIAEDHPVTTSPVQKSKRRGLFIFLGLLALVIVVLAIVLPIIFVVVKPNHKSATSQQSGSPGSNPTATGGAASPTSSSKPISAAAITGGDGSTVTANDGSTFTYSNSFGGIWYSDPSDPYNNNAFPNSWTPPLNQTWDFAANRIYGVNLGGWFVLEPFITPALYQKYPGAIDEWTLSTLMAADTSAGGGISQIEDHYKTFITEQDIAQIAGAGLNWIRLPIPFWAIDKWNDEPFLEKVSWKYILQALQWCRKYGLRVKLDLHTIPGSQNAFNHSGKDGQIDFLMGVMGMANAQRAINYIRIITEFISQPEWSNVVPIFGIINEAEIKLIGTTEMRGFYREVYDMIRGITGIGAGKGPYISIHDGFQALDQWVGFLQNGDRVALDTHPYFAFDGQSNTAPIDTGTGADAGGTWPQSACNSWGGELNTSRSNFGVTFAGEFSNGFNDCGLFVRGVGGQPVFGGDCSTWTDSTNWTPSIKAGVQAFAMASMDALGDWFFWTWKIGNSTKGIVEAPLWSYQLGLENGWMPLDPRTAIGKCGAPDTPFDGTFQPWQTGSGGGTLAASQTSLYPYPPTDLQGTDVAQLPLYTSTGSIATLPAPTFTDASGKMVSSSDDGWFNAGDNAPGPTPIPGCAYPDPWNALDVPIPTGCTGGADAALPAVITPPPRR